MATLSFDVFWRDHGAKAGLKGLSKEAKEAAAKQKEFKAAAVTAGLGAAAAIVGFAKASVQAYTESQTAQAKLEDAFRRFPALADTNIGALQDLNSALALKTRFDDDATSAAEAQLAQYKLTGRQIQTLIPLVQDYAAKTGKDLGEAATVAGKAILGNGKALKEIGLNFKDAGSSGANFTQLVTGLRRQVGGFAEVEGKSAAGQAAILSNQFGELQEAAGAQLLPVLLKLGHTLLDMVGWVQANQAVVVPLAKTLGVLALGIIAVNKTAAGVRAASSAWDVLTTSMKGFTGEGGKARTALKSVTGFLGGPWGAALVVGGGLLALWAKKHAEARQYVDDLRKSLDEQTGALTANSKETIYNALVESGAVASAKRLGVSLDDLTDAALGNADAQARVKANLDASGASATSYAQTVGRGAHALAGMNGDAVTLTDAIGGQNQAIEKAKQQWKDHQEAMGGATAAVDGMTGALGDQNKKLGDNIDKLSERDALLGKRDAERQYQQAIDDLTASLKENGKHFDTNSEKGRKNNEALDSLAKAAGDYKKAIADAGGSQATVNKIQQDAYLKLRRAAEAMGYGKEKAADLARALLGIPKQTTATVSARTAQARAAIADVRAQLNALHSRNLFVNLVVKNRNAIADLRAQGYAGGGAVGSGVGYRDSQLALLTPGEHVLTTADVRRAGGHAGVMAWRRGLAQYAGGGPVGGVYRAGGMAGTTVINQYSLSAPNYLGSRAELLQGLYDLARQGRLEPILARRV